MPAQRVFFRCPFCGSLRRRKGWGEPLDDGYGGITLSGPLQVSFQTITSEGRGKIRNEWDHFDVDQVLRGADLEEFLSELIRNAEGVLQGLKSEWYRYTGREWSEDDESDADEEDYEDDAG